MVEPAQIIGGRDAPWRKRLPIRLVIAGACVFTFVHAYRIDLPGIQFDEIIFADAAQGNTDTALTPVKLGPVPLFVFPYIGALKSWIYAPVFHFFGVSALTIRLPIVLIAAATLLIWYRALREGLGGIWAAAVVWLLAVDPAFPGRLDYGPVVLMHVFQAFILALWFSYRDGPKLWKIGLISLCCGLGFFDKFNFIWFLAAFVASIFLCYPDSVRDLWVSSPKFIRWIGMILVLIALIVAMFLIFPLIQFPAAGTLRTHLIQSWGALQITLSGAAMAGYVFGSYAGLISIVPYWLIVADASLALVCLLLPMANANARENRRSGLFCLLIGFLIFVQIVITPQASGPHHHSMLFPLPLLAFAFFARSLYGHFRTMKLSWLVPLTTGVAATCMFLVSVHNTMIYLSHFRSDPHYNPLWSPAIYALSRYIDEHGRDSERIICADLGACIQLHVLAPRKLRRRIRDLWPVFKELPKTPEDQNAVLKSIFPEGKTLVVTFDAGKETLPQTRENFFALVAAHPELNFRLVRQFWYGGEKIYEVYEVVRPPRGA